MNVTDLRFALVELRRDGVPVDRVELTQDALNNIHSSLQTEAETDSTRSVRGSSPRPGIPGGAVDVVVGDSNRVIAESGETYDL